MDESLYQPVATCDIPMPILEGPASAELSAEPELPRILLQAAGRERSSRNLLVLTGLFLVLAILEGVLLLRMRVEEALVVYEDGPRQILLSPELK